MPNRLACPAARAVARHAVNVSGIFTSTEARPSSSVTICGAHSAVARLCGLFVLLIATTANADNLPTPASKIVLTVSGQISNSNDGAGATFDMEMLRALPQSEFSTTTIWTDGKRRFVGVALSNLLKRVGASGDRLIATALNDYAIEIPIDEISVDAPIVAYELDGKAMPVRAKGPLWIVYPYDADSRYRSEKIYARSIWQLNRIEVSD